MNFTNWVHEGGHDNILFTPNGLTQAADAPCIHKTAAPLPAFHCWATHHRAGDGKKYGVQLVMYGENQAEYGNDPKENFKPTMDTKFFSARSLGMRLRVRRGYHPRL